MTLSPARHLGSALIMSGFLILAVGSSEPVSEASLSGPEGNRSGGSPASGDVTVTLADGSALRFHDVRPMPDWACGTRQSATFDGGDVVLYYDRENRLVSANVPAAGNEKFYEADPNKSCLKNWKTGQFEMLTQREYRKFSRQRSK